MRIGNKVLKTAIIVVILISLGILIRTTDLQKVISSIRLIGFRFFLLLLITFIAYLLATIGWKYCFKKEARILSIYDLFLIRHVGEMLSIVNPASVVGGEAMKIYMLQNKGIEKTDVVASVLISRVMMAITQVIIFVISLTVVYSSNTHLFDSLPHLQLKLTVTLVLSIMLTALVIKSHYITRLVTNSKFYLLIKKFVYQWKLKQVFSTINGFFQKDLKSLLCCTFFFLIHWIIGSLEVYFILFFLGIKASLFQIILADMGIVLFKAAGAFVPGQIGVEEMGNKIMLGFIGISNDEIWITVSILRRTRQLFWIVIGLTAYLIYSKRVNNLPDLS